MSVILAPCSVTTEVLAKKLTELSPALLSMAAETSVTVRSSGGASASKSVRGVVSALTAMAVVTKSFSLSRLPETGAAGSHCPMVTLPPAVSSRPRRTEIR